LEDNLEEERKEDSERPEEIKEKTEELVKTLLEEEKKEELSEKEKPEEKRKFNFKKFLPLLLIILIILFLIAGLFVLYILLFKKPASKEVSQVPKKIKEKEASLEVENKTLEKPLSKGKIPLQEESPSKKYPYKLEIKNFLLSLNENTFLKCDITLYFLEYEDLNKALGRELYLRKFFLNKFKGTKEELWKREKDLSAFEKKLLEDLEKSDFKVGAIELEPILLKV